MLSVSRKNVVARIEAAASKAIAVQADVSKVPEVPKLINETLAHFGRRDVIVFDSGKETSARTRI